MPALSPSLSNSNVSVVAPSLSSFAEAYVAAKRTEEAASAAVKAAGAQLLAAMSSQNVTGLKVGEASVSLVGESTGSSLDTAAALASIEAMKALVNELAGRLAALGEDVQLPADLGTLSYKTRVTAPSLRCKMGGAK